MKKLIIFDVGGTLTDIQNLYLNTNLILLRKRHIIVEGERLQQIILKINEEWENQFPDFNIIDSTAFFTAKVLKAFSIDSKEEIERYAYEFRNSLDWNKVSLFDDVHPVISTLRSSGYKLATLSNGNDINIHNMVLNNLSLDKSFDFHAYSSVIGFRKPDAKAYQYVLDFFNVEPEESIMVGDSLSVDIYGANISKISSVWLNRYNIKVKLKETNRPTYEINNLYQLVKVLSFK